jgi:hypothetical protein
MREDEMGRERSMQGGEDECIFGGKARRRDITKKT